MSVISSPTPAEHASSASAHLPVSRAWALPVCVLFLKGAGWLVLSSIFGLIASIKFHSPEFLADAACLTYGRVQAAAFHSLLYGFCLPAGLGFAAWRFARATPDAAHTPLPGLITAGAAIWNLGVLVGIVGILLGDLSGFSGFEMPGYAAPILFAGYALIAIWAAITFQRREQRPLATSQWFLIAALFWFPWIFSTAALLLNQFPVRGIAQSVVAWWYNGNLSVVWMGLTGIAGITFLGLRFGWRPAVSRNLALFLFWTLILFGSWTGIPATAPVPAWMVAISKITSVLLVLPAIVLAIICFGRNETVTAVTASSRVVSFIKLGAICFILHLVALALPAFFHLESRVLFTWFTNGNALLVSYGFFTLVMFAVIYAFAADVSGGGMPFPRLVRAHFFCAVIGIALIVIPLMAGGIMQGRKLANPDLAFIDVSRSTLMFLRVSTIGDLLLLAGHALFLVNFGVFVQRMFVNSLRKAFSFDSNVAQARGVNA